MYTSALAKKASHRWQATRKTIASYTNFAIGEWNWNDRESTGSSAIPLITTTYVPFCCDASTSRARSSFLTFCTRPVARLTHHVYEYGENGASAGVHVQLCAATTEPWKFGHIAYYPGLKYTPCAARNETWNRRR
jgi:hypothetical protein